MKSFLQFLLPMSVALLVLLILLSFPQIEREGMVGAGAGKLAVAGKVWEPESPDLAGSRARRGVDQDPEDAPALTGKNPGSAMTTPGRPGAVRAPTAADARSEGGTVSPMPLPPGFLDQLTDPSGERVAFPLPDGTHASGNVQMILKDAAGVLSVQGVLTEPSPGTYFFQRQTAPGVAGSMVGHVRFENGERAWRVDPAGEGGGAILQAVRVEQLICVDQPLPLSDGPDEDAKSGGAVAGAQGGNGRGRHDEALNIPHDHPSDQPVPFAQNGIIPLESLPGAEGVIYLDFDGEQGPFTGWPSMERDAAAAGISNAAIKDIWHRVAEDFQPFNLNVTTVRKTFDEAAESTRQQVIVTSTADASPGAGGVAFVGSFNWTGNTVCWAFLRSGKSAAEAISHEVGHTLGLSHDGRISPPESYHQGHGSGETGWAPVMGLGYYQNLTQWSRGEYTGANNQEDDLAILTNNNNGVAYREEEGAWGDSTTGFLDIRPDFSVRSEGILNRTGEVEVWHFETSGGDISLLVSPVPDGPNLDVQAGIFDHAGDPVIESNPENLLTGSLAASLPAGSYTLRVQGTGRGNAEEDGYSGYGSLGAYQISGTVMNGTVQQRFYVEENAPAGSVPGMMARRPGQEGHLLTYRIAGGNTGGALNLGTENGGFSVRSPAALDYESLSSRWDDPAELGLFIEVTDHTDPTMTEMVRVIVEILPVNEAPVVSGGAVTLFAGTRPGTFVSGVTASDPDRFEVPIFELVDDGGPGGFAVDAASGIITTTASLPMVAPEQPILLTIRAVDRADPELANEAIVAVTLLEAPSGYAAGGVTRSFYDNISGTRLEDLTGHPDYPDQPGRTEIQKVFDDSQQGDDYGSTSRAWLLPPVTGSYTFWIASDEESELWIGSGASSGGAVLRASAPQSTGRYQYTRFRTQRSVPLNLTAGQPYYIEARHKEGEGFDYLTVAWQGPDFDQQVIPGRYLAPWQAQLPPVIGPQTLAVRRDADRGSRLGFITVSGNAARESLHSWIITGGTAAGWAALDANSGLLYVKNPEELELASGHTQTLTMRVADGGHPPLIGTGSIELEIVESGEIAGPGSNLPPGWPEASFSFKLKQSAGEGAWVGRVAASDPEGGGMVYRITAGNVLGTYAVNPFTGDLRVANSAGLFPGSSVLLTVRVQDDGSGGLLPLAVAETTVAMEVQPDLTPVSPARSVVNLPVGQGLELALLPGGGEDRTMKWELMAGQGTAAFDRPTSWQTGVTFSTHGIYRLRGTQTASGIPQTIDYLVQTGLPGRLPSPLEIGQGINADWEWSGAAWSIEAAGAGLAGSGADGCFFLQQPVEGDTVITARFSELVASAGERPVVGLMIREGPAADAAFVFCGFTAQNEPQFRIRSTAGFEVIEVPVLQAPALSADFSPKWIRLRRTGDEFTAFFAPDVSGSPGEFEFIGVTRSVPLPAAASGGAVVFSGSTGVSSAVTLDQLTFSPGLANLAPVVGIAQPSAAPLASPVLLKGTVTDDSLPPVTGSLSVAWSQQSGEETVVFGSANEASTTATFDAPGSYRLRLTADDGEVRTFREITLSLGLLDPIDAWRAGQFGADANDPLIAGDLADPDADGLLNLLEYAFGLDPQVHDQQPLVTSQTVIGDSVYFQVSGPRNPAASDIQLIPEFSLTPDLPGSWTGEGVVLESLSPAGFEARTLQPLSALPAQFIRIRVSR